MAIDGTRLPAGNDFGRLTFAWTPALGIVTNAVRRIRLF
jgi:hypothetical protein